MYSFEAADCPPPDNLGHPLGQVLQRHAGDPAIDNSPWRKFFESYPAASEDGLAPPHALPFYMSSPFLRHWEREQT